MVRIRWERQPLLLFSDVHRIGPVSFQHFQTPPMAPLASTTFKWDSQKGTLFYSIFVKIGWRIKLYWCPRVLPPLRAEGENTLCGSMLNQCQQISLGCRKMLQRHSVP